MVLPPVVGGLGDSEFAGDGSDVVALGLKLLGVLELLDDLFWSMASSLSCHGHTSFLPGVPGASATLIPIGLKPEGHSITSQVIDTNRSVRDMNEHQTVGALVRQWRERRRRSQLELSMAAEVSTRHLSFIETGRAQPSRQMIERLCDELDVPLRQRNSFYLTAGFAPAHPEHPLDDLGAATEAVEAVLAGHEPNPAVAINARWDLLAANEAMKRFLWILPQHLREPKLNMLRATMHPDGLANQLANEAQWRELTLRRVRRQYERTADPELMDLLRELEGYSQSSRPSEEVPGQQTDLVTPMLLNTDFGQLSLLYAVTVFGSPRDVTLDEIAIETSFPADHATREILSNLAQENVKS